MTNHYIIKSLRHFILIICILSTGINFSQNFSQSTLKFNGIGSVNRVTSLMYGPDGRLYTCEYEGLVKIFTIERVGNSNYKVVAMETLNGIQTIQNHNDDGSLDNTTFRQTTGLTVAGTSSNPIIYVTSSDIRVGGGNHGGGGDVGLDTNSGTITRFTWNGTSWDVVDIVRGLPRSEENHALSGLEFVTVNGTDYLIVTSGGNTNLGSPGYNFTYLPEFALSAAVLSVNLNMIEALPIQTVNNRKFIYDMPTLDDPTRPNVNGITDPDDPGYDGIDINDPFGGNDGLNQAKIVPGGPVQIFSPGYRNTYDIVVTEKGAVFATDNGANGGWGGLPFNEGLLDAQGNSLATNNYVNGEHGSTSHPSGEWANNLDHLQWITNNIQTYTFGSYYGGHANPTRANPFHSGWYTAPEQFGNAGAVFRTKVYDPDGSRPGSTTDPNIALPADWPPVPIDHANPVEGDFRGPGLVNPDGPIDSPILIWGTNTNGIDEYTASNFNGAMKGDLLAGTNTGELRRVQLNEDNTLKEFNPSFVSGLSGNALGVTCNSDFDIFPGTIWIGNFNNSITILEPQDFVICINPGDEGYDPYADYDNDGYSNQDELDNMTDPCNGASQPQDFDKSTGGILISDLNDPDDDNDGIPDALDPFQLGNPNDDGSDAFIVPVVNELFSDTYLGGYRGLGFTGMMNNGDTGANWLNWLDRRDDPNDPNPNDVLGGAIGAMTMQMTSGTALGLVNNQEKAFQYGVQVDQNTGVFVVTGGIVNFNQPLQLYGNSAAPNGELGFYIGDGTQSNYIKFVARQQGLRVQQEINDIPQLPIDLPIDSNDRPNGSIIFNFIVNPSNGEITFEYVFDNDPPQIFGSLFAEGSILTAIQESTLDLAVGLIGTSNVMGVELEGTWGVLNVIPEALNPIIYETVGDQTHTEGDNLDGTFGIIASGGDGSLTYQAIGLPDGLSINSTTGKISGNISLNASKGSPYNVSIIIDDSDFDNTDIQVINFIWTVLDFWDHSDYYTVPYARVNAGGSLITSSDNSNVNWIENNTNGAFTNSTYSVNSGNNIVGITGITKHESIPDHIDINTFNQIFSSERWKGPGAPMEYAFPLPNDSYIVNIFLANSHAGTSNPGERIFNIEIEGATVRSGIDLITEFGHKVGGMLAFLVHVTDGTLNIRFSHGLIQNPLVNAIEIRSVMLGSPILVNPLEDQTNNEGDALDGSLGVLANGGEGNLSYTAIGLPPGVVIEPINGQIGGAIAFGAAVNSPYHVTIIVDDSDDSSDDAVTLNFDWIVNSSPTLNVNTAPLLRVNTGGQLITASDNSNVNWIENNTNGAYTNNIYSVTSGNNIVGITGVYRHASIPDYINGNTFNEIFGSERWDGKLAPEMEFNVPLANANYLVNIFLANTHHSTSDSGKRIFDIAIEGNLVKTNLDLVAEFGHKVGGMLSFPVTLTDGILNIQFLHGPIENPLVNAIEIREFVVENTIVVETPENQFNSSGDILDGSLQVIASGGDGALSFSATGLPPGLTVNPDNGQITGTITAEPGIMNTYDVTITVDDDDEFSTDAISVEFIWTVTNPLSSLSLEPLYRVNAGGALVAPTDGNVNWEANDTTGNYNGTNFSVNTGSITKNITGMAKHASIPSYIDNTTFSALFANERWNPSNSPGMTFSFPITNGDYVVNLYLGSSYKDTNDPGERIFDIAIEGNIVKSDLDLVTEFGHKVGGMLSFPVSVTDGTLNIQFLRGPIENPLVNAIEIMSLSEEIQIVANPIENQFNSPGDILDGSLQVIASGGDGALSFSATGLPPGLTVNPDNGQITGTITAEPGIMNTYDVTITVDDDDEFSTDAISVEFIWTVTNPLSSLSLEPLYRVNAGGALVAPTDGNVNWEANDTTGNYNGTNFSVNTGSITKNITGMAKHASIPSYIDNATFSALFANERWNPSNSPGMTFSFPITNGDYVVNLYLGSSYKDTNDPGERIFNIAIEGNIVRPNLDLVTEFGHKVGGMLSFPVSVTDGTLNIQFLRGPIENPLVNAIEIMSLSEEIQIVANPIENQFNSPGDILDGSLQVIASGGDGALSFSATGLPPGLTVNPDNGQITGTITAEPGIMNTYDVTITVDDDDEFSTDTVSVEFIWTIHNTYNPTWIDKNENENYSSRHENSFVQAGDKFYLMGGRENSKTIDIYDYTSDTWTSLVNSAPFEFNHFQATEYQGLIWVIGAFKSNSYPNEVPAEFVWSFDPTSEIWIQGPEIPVSRRRGSAGLVIHNDKFYVVAGNNNGHDGGYVAWFDEFDPATGQWKVLEDAPRARDHFFATVINNKLYAAGGRLSGGSGGTFTPTISEVDVYDFLNMTWSTLPPSQNIPTPRGGAATAVFENKLFIIGGEVSNQLIDGELTSDALALTEIFDPELLTWTRGSDLNHKRHGTQAIVSGGGIYILGGSTNLGGGNQKNMEFYGTDNPIGIPSIPSIISTTPDVTINGINGSNLSLDVLGGNVGIIIKSMEISGINAHHFEITSGAISNGLIKANSSHNLNITYTGLDDDIYADLIINYDNENSLTVTLMGISNNSAKMQPEGKNNNDLSNKNGESLNNSDIYFYPNPASSEVIIHVSNKKVSDIYINDISGRMIKSYKATILKYAEDQYRLDVSELSNGMYFINLKTDETVLSTKLIVQK